MPWRSLLACLLALLASVGPARASGDYGCGGPIWTLEHRDYGCAGIGMLAPGNDTRTNLILLVLDQRGRKLAGMPYGKLQWEDQLNGRSYFDLGQLEAAVFPAPKSDAEVSRVVMGSTWPDESGHCTSVSTGKADFLAALAASKGIPPTEKDMLRAAREGLSCGYVGYNVPRNSATLAPLPTTLSSVVSSSGRQFANYLIATHAFYSRDWGKARDFYARLDGASEPWVAEAADYMAVRVFLNAAVSEIPTDNPFWPETRIDKVMLGRAHASLDAYLKAWPSGRYAASAKGLRRRIYSHAGDRAGLAREYSALLAQAPLDHSLPGLIDEIDNHYFLAESEGGPPAPAGANPTLVAVSLLSRMREHRFYGDAKSDLTKAEQLDAYRSTFANHPDLFAFLQANLAYYVEKDHRRVLELIPDDARRDAYSTLAFSRQMLRGMALAALKDRNEEAFWRQLLHGADETWQRPVAELGLARNFERRGKIAAVFAKGSPIRDETIRIRLLAYSAGPAVLRAAAQDRSRPKRERDHALFAWAYRSLAHGRYAEFVAASRLIPANAPTDWQRDAESEYPDPIKLGLSNYFEMPEVPLGLFTRGEKSENIACPSLAQTAARLAARPHDNHAKLCLGDFWRNNEFDYFDDFNRKAWRYYGEAKPQELGMVSPQYPGKRIHRGQLYTEVIADPRASADDKAYALYRAVRCFSSTNDCFDKDVPREVRRGWFRQLKRDYPNSRWARQLEYYW